MKIALLFVALICVSQVFGSNTAFDALAQASGLLNRFDHCKVLQTLAASPEKVAITLHWSNKGATFDFGLAAQTDGWIGFGVSNSSTAPGTRMFQNDITIGSLKTNALNANPIVEDYFVGKTQQVCIKANKEGICRDIDIGGADQLTNKNMSFFTDAAANPGVAVLTYTRPTAASDAFDFAVKNGVQQYIFAYSALSGATTIDYHGSTNRDAVLIDLFSTSVACPVAANGKECNGVGTCSKGCCICPTDSGADCSVAASGGNEQVNKDLNTYQFKQELDSKLTLHWNFDTVAQTVEIGLVCQCTGWIAFGPSPQGQMIGTDAVIAWVAADGTVVINDFLIKDRAANAIFLDTQLGGTNDILGSFVEVANGVTTVIFKRFLVTSDVNDSPYSLDGNTGISWAYQPTTTGPANPPYNIEQHLPDTKKPININFSNGAGGGLGALDQQKLAHGVLMGVIWAIAIPITSFIARYLKSQLGHAWFEIHRIVNGIAMLIQLAAFILAVIFVQGLHFNNAHKIIGLIVFILGTVQPVLGVIADRLFDPNRESAPIFPDKIHWVIGWLSLLLGLVNIPLGAFYFPSPQAGLIATAAISAIVGGFLIIFAIQNLITKWPHADH